VESWPKPKAKGMNIKTIVCGIMINTENKDLN